jgi:hypothetical protein
VEGSFERGYKFALISASLSPGGADADSEDFAQASRARNTLFHERELDEATLPVRAVQRLTGKYLQLHLRSATQLPLGPIPERYRSAPPSEITVDRAALRDKLLARQPGENA